MLKFSGHVYIAKEVSCYYSSIRSLTHLLPRLFVDAELDFPVGALTQLPTDLEPKINMSTYELRIGIK